MGKVFLQFFFALKIVAIETLCLPQQSETNRPTAKRKKNSFQSILIQITTTTTTKSNENETLTDPRYRGKNRFFLLGKNSY